MTMIGMKVVENDAQKGKYNDDSNNTIANSTLDNTLDNTLGSTPSLTGEKILISCSSDEDDDDQNDTTSEVKRCSLTEDICSELLEEEPEQDDGPTPILKTSATKKLTTRPRSVSDAHLLEKSSSSETTTSIQQQQKRRCRFSTLTVREYPRILGDNVTVMGPPISLSWEYEDESVYDLEEYLIAVQDSKRIQAELKIPSMHRDMMLRESGYSRKEIQTACKKSTIARNQRKRTIETLKLQPLEEFLEKVKKNGKKNPIRLLRKKNPIELLLRKQKSESSLLMKRKTI